MHIDLAQGGDAKPSLYRCKDGNESRRRVRRRENPTVMVKMCLYHHAAQTNNTRRFRLLERCSRRGVALAG